MICSAFSGTVCRGCESLTWPFLNASFADDAQYRRGDLHLAEERSMLEVIRSVYDYNAWANRRILDTAERLKLQQFIAPNGGGESVREILVHIASAQWTWLGRWQGAAPRQRWSAGDLPYVAPLLPRWGEV